VVGGFYQPLSGSEPPGPRRSGWTSDGGGSSNTSGPTRREHGEVQELLDGALAMAREPWPRRDAGDRGPAGTCAFGKGGCEFPTICRCERLMGAPLSQARAELDPDR